MHNMAEIEMSIMSVVAGLMLSASFRFASISGFASVRLLVLRPPFFRRGHRTKFVFVVSLRFSHVTSDCARR